VGVEVEQDGLAICFVFGEVAVFEVVEGFLSGEPLFLQSVQEPADLVCAETLEARHDLPEIFKNSLEDLEILTRNILEIRDQLLAVSQGASQLLICPVNWQFQSSWLQLPLQQQLSLGSHLLHLEQCR